MYQDGPHRGERERGMGKGSSHTVVYLDGEESSALIIWRWSARLPGGRVGSTPNESTSGASGKSRCETSSSGRIATTRPQQHPLSRMVAIPTGVDWGNFKGRDFDFKTGKVLETWISWSPYTWVKIVCFNHLSDLESTCCCLAAKLCPTLCHPMDCSPLGSSVHEVFQARIWEWVDIFSCRRSAWLRDQTCVSCIGRGILYCWATWEAPQNVQHNSYFHALFTSHHPTLEWSEITSNK